MSKPRVSPYRAQGRSIRERALAEGAAEIAPTAPHATPPTGRTRAQVGRVWRPLGVVFAVAMAASLGVHVGIAVRALGESADVDFLDNDDELTIPIDMFEEAPPAAPAPPPTPEPPPVVNDPSKPGDAFLDAGVRIVDAGPRDAGPRDAAIDLRDAEVPDASASDAGEIADGGGIALSEQLGASDAGAADGGADGGGVSSGPRDPSSIVGMPGLVSTSGPVNVTLLVNMAAIRQHPVGRRIGPLILEIPQWKSFIHGNETNVDPLRDTNWIMIYGPSLIHTEKDAVLIHYSASDAIVDRAIELVREHYDKGGPFDTGVAGVKASLAHADNAERVFLRASSKLLAVVPPDKAKDFARLLKSKGAKPHIDANEAMRLIVRNPHRQIAIKGLKFPTELEELRIWIVPNADGSAVVHVEGTVNPTSACDDVGTTMSDVLKRINGPMVQLATGGLLNKVSIACEDGVPKTALSATKQQIEGLLSSVGMLMGVPLAP